MAGEEHAWKEVKDAVNEVRYPKSKEGILSVTGYSLSFSCENIPIVCSSCLEISFLIFTLFLLYFFKIHLMFKMCKILNCINNRVSDYLEWNYFVAEIVTTKDMKGYFGSDLGFCSHSLPFHINPLPNERKLNLEC